MKVKARSLVFHNWMKDQFIQQWKYFTCVWHLPRHWKTRFLSDGGTIHRKPSCPVTINLFHRAANATSRAAVSSCAKINNETINHACTRTNNAWKNKINAQTSADLQPRSKAHFGHLLFLTVYPAESHHNQNIILNRCNTRIMQNETLNNK